MLFWPLLPQVPYAVAPVKGTVPKFTYSLYDFWYPWTASSHCPAYQFA